MTLGEVLNMTAEGFSKACESCAATNTAPDKLIEESEIRKLEQYLRDFSDFKQSRESTIAFHEIFQYIL
jgi:hypothetical protein